MYSAGGWGCDDLNFQVSSQAILIPFLQCCQSLCAECKKGTLAELAGGVCLEEVMEVMAFRLPLYVTILATD